MAAAAAPKGPAGMKGKLTVTVIEVKELKDTEILGKMDPYVEMEVGKEKHKTSVKKNAGRQATFNESFIFNLEGKEDVLHLHVWDKELISDDHVGRVDIHLHKLVADAASSTKGNWYQLVDRNNFSKIAGQACISVEFKGTGGPAVAQAAQAAAAAAKQPHPPAAAAAVAVAPQQVMYAAQPQQVMYAAPQMAAQPQMMYAQQPQVVMAAPQPQLVRGTDGKLYAIAQPQVQQQPQVVYVQAPAGGVVMQQQPRYM